MQTFLPYPDFRKSLACLDYRRLGKQRVEGRQLETAIRTGTSKGWVNHPATKMWAKNLDLLCLYTDMCIVEWVKRGYNNTMDYTFDPVCHGHVFNIMNKPDWLGDEAFHASHRSNLLRKDPEWYGQFGWSEPHDLEYVWPVK